MSNDKTVLEKWKIPLRDGLRTYYFDIATNVFDWKNMPEEIPNRFPEKWLYDNGLCVFFQPDGLDYMVLPVTVGSIRKNVYGEPAQWRATAVGELAGIINSQTLDSSNSVLIRNDFAYRPTKPYVNSLIDQLINVELTTRMNINAQKMPFMFKGDENTALQNKQTFLDLLECEPVWFKNKFANQEFEVLVTGAPMICSELTDVYTEYDARILTYLGVDNLPIEKKERLLTDEVGVNKEEKSLIRTARLKQRQTACEQINKIFNLDISVDIAEELKNDQSMQGTFGTGGGFGQSE